MTEQKLRAMMQRSAEEPSEGFDERIAFQLMNLTRKEEPRMKRSASIIVVFALVLALGMGTALAAFNDDANQLLYQIWPQAAMALRPVNLISESQGIRMEVVSATLNGTESLVMLTMQDLEDDRIDETTDLFDSANLQLPYDGAGTCIQTGYNPETKTASFAVYMDFNIDHPAESDKVSFRVSRFLSHKQEHTVDLTQYITDTIEEADSMPVPAIRGWGGNPTNTDDHQANTDTVRRLRVLNTQNSLEIPIVEGVTLTGIGMIDGALHVQIRYSDILHTDNHGFLTLTDREGKTYRDTGLPGIGSVSWFGENHDSWEEYIFEHYPEDFSEVTLTGEFTTADPAVEGDWYVTFPLSLIQAQGN